MIMFYHFLLLFVSEWVGGVDLLMLCCCWFDVFKMFAIVVAK